MARPCTAALQTFLEEWSPLTNAAQCDLYTITLVGGEVLRFSGYQRAVRAPAPETDTPLITFPLGPPVNRTSTTLKVGVEVDVIKIEIFANGHELVLNGGSLTWQQIAKTGLFDGAYCDVWRCFMSPPRTVIGTLRWFYGRVADLEIGRTKIVMQVKSLLDQLNVQMPRRMFQASCTHVFGDEMCGYNRTLGENALGVSTGKGASTITTITGTVQSQLHYAGAAPNPSTLYDNGTVIGATGANTGYKRTITRVLDGIVYILDPWVFPITIGDTFTLLPGCDHTLDTCDEVFDNLDRFGGFPYVPPPENAV